MKRIFTTIGDIVIEYGPIAIGIGMLVKEISTGVLHQYALQILTKIYG